MIAIGMGFSARGAILGDWGATFGFTRAELGVITGFGLTGFGLTVMFFSVLVERWGYRAMLGITFSFHLLSGVITLMATRIFHAFGRDAAFWCLSIGTTVFAVGNGAAEGAVNPLIAALYPARGRTGSTRCMRGSPAAWCWGRWSASSLPDEAGKSSCSCTWCLRSYTAPCC